MAGNNHLSIFSLQGGLDDTSSQAALENDACTLAENVEFIYSTLGERRAGCVEITLPASFFGLDAITWMYRHIPANNPEEAQLWALAQDLTGVSPAYQLAYKDTTGWHDVTLSDALISTVPNGHAMQAVTLHGKMFLAYKSAVDRLHVWDGTSVRRCGLAEPSAAPTGGNTGTGTLSGTRYYRVRYTVQSGGETILRSEPSAVLTFTPSGTGTGVVVTKPASISEGETHWELEASLDNANFYVLATTAVGTSTVTDSTAFRTGYSEIYTLSDDVGDYTLIPSVKYLAVDEDRLMTASSYEDETLASRVAWTPVWNSPGVGNDERYEYDTDPYLDLDGYEGGGLTSLSRATNGYMYVQKLSHTYKLVRQGQRTNAYQSYPITKAVGAFQNSLVEAIDQAGNPSVYFLDLKQGPYRIGEEGLQWCGRDIQTLWSRMNVNALVPCHGVYDSQAKQVHFWLALDDSDYPNAKIVLHVNKMRNTEEGARRGWVTVPVDDVIAAAHCSELFSTNIEVSAARTRNLKPFIGTESTKILRCGTGTDDNGTDFRAKVRTKPFWPGNLMNHSQIMAATILTKAVDVVGAEITVKAIRDFGLETTQASTSIEAVSTEEHLIKQLDDLAFAELYAVQFEIGDIEVSFTPASWSVDALVLKLTTGQSA